LYAFTVTTLTPLDQQGPVILGYVDLPGDVRVFAQIDADPDTVTCDSTVSLRAAEPITAPSGERVRYFQFVPDADLAEGESCAGS
jgi:benzoylsuccinyl-CoA thiolase BbsA subunit